MDCGKNFNWAKIGVTVAPTGSGNKKVFCPNCHDRRTDKRDKSLSVNMATGQFKCHYCDYSGTIAEPSADERLAWMRQQDWWKEPVTRSYSRPEVRPLVDLSPEAIEWFRGRGISQTILAKARVSRGTSYIDGQAVDAIQFNFYRDGELVNVKTRAKGKKFRQHAGAEQVPYLIDNIRDTSECIIVEGEIDALSFMQVGRDDVISVPSGANGNLDWLPQYYDSHFANKAVIYIAVDTDAKGKELCANLLRRFVDIECRVVTFGDNKDANEVLQAEGGSALLNYLATSKQPPMEGVFTVADVEDELNALYKDGHQRGKIIGLDDFDNLVSFETKRIMIVTGIPGCGKSEFIDELAVRMNVRYSWRWALFSPENQPLVYHYAKIISKLTGKNFHSANLPLSEYTKAKERMSTDFYSILPPDYKLDTVLMAAKELIKRRGIKGLVIDPYNRLEPEDQGDLNETTVISKILDKLTNFAVHNDILVILMAHPRKMAKEKEDGTIECPNMYDISGSANWYNKADYGIIVHRQKGQPFVTIKVEKVKFRHLGEPGECVLAYSRTSGRYANNTAISARGCFENDNWIDHPELCAGETEQRNNVHSWADDTFVASEEQEIPF